VAVALTNNNKDPSTLDANNSNTGIKLILNEHMKAVNYFLEYFKSMIR